MPNTKKKNATASVSTRVVNSPSSASCSACNAKSFTSSSAVNAPEAPLLLDQRTGQLRHCSKCSLRRIQPEPEVFIREGLEHIDRLMPGWIPSRAGVGEALILAQADCRDQILERTRVGIAHAITNRSRIVGCVAIVHLPEEERELLGFCSHFRGTGELNVHIRLAALFGIEFAVGTRHTVIPEHHVVLNHAQ